MMLALFFVVSASAFNPRKHLGCDFITPTNSSDAPHLPQGVSSVCKLDDDAYSASSHAIVVDMNGVAIPDYFLLNILQLVFMIMFNDICMITVAWDNVKDSRIPKKWDLRRLYTLAAVMCAVVTCLQLLYLSMGFAAMRPVSMQPERLNIFWWFGLHEPLQFSEMETMMYISLSWAGFLTLLSCRNEGPFWESLPGVQLCCAFVVSVAATTLIGGLLKADAVSFWACPPTYIALTLLFNLLMFLVLDLVKVIALHLIARLEGRNDWAKLSQLQLWSANRATLARESSRPIEYSTASANRAPRARSASASSDVDRLLQTVGKLAELVGSMAVDQGRGTSGCVPRPDARTTIAEILDSIKPIAERSRLGSR